jgi:hypothetical protein
MTGPPTSPAVSRKALWFGAFGGAVAWLLHLVGAAVIAEWGCFAGLYRTTWLGLTVVAWMIIAVSVATAVAAIAATVTAGMVYSRTRWGDSERLDPRGTARFLAWFGLVSSGLFLFIIVAETIPLLFFLTHC